MALNMINAKSKKFDPERGMTIDALRKTDSSSVYVMNLMSKRSKDKQSSIISITIRRAGAEALLLLVPSTWVPVDLSMQVPKSQLLESPEFLQVVNRRMVKILSVEEAEAVLEDEDAQIEAQRVTDQINGANVELVEDDIASVSESADPLELQKQSAKRLTELPKIETVERSSQELASERVHPQIAGLCARDDVNARDVQSQLRILESNLVRGDYEYLQVNLPSSAKDSKLMAYISEKIRTAVEGQQIINNEVK